MNYKDFELLGHTFLGITILSIIVYCNIAIIAGNVNNSFDLIAVFFVLSSVVMYYISMALFAHGKRFGLIKEEQQ